MRAVPEWIGKHDDAPIPPRVQLRIYMQTDGHCAICTRRLVPHHWSCDHIIALVNKGEHRESNLRAVCNSPCHRDKSRADLKEKSKVYRAASANAGIRRPSRMQSRGFDKTAPQRSASRPLERRS